MEEFLKHLNELIIKLKLKLKEIYTNYKEASIVLWIIFFIVFIEFLPLLIFLFILYFVYFIISKKHRENKEKSSLQNESTENNSENNNSETNKNDILFNISNKNFFETNLWIKIISIYKKILGLFFKVLLFLVWLWFIIYIFLPKDIKANIENAILDQLFEIRLDFTDIDYNDTVDNLFSKYCGQYVNKDICELRLFYSISANNKSEELYNYCIKKENSIKKFCSKNYNHMTAWTILNKLPIFEKELEKWKKDNNIDLRIELDIPDYSRRYYNPVSSWIGVKILGNWYFYEILNNKYFISKWVDEKAFYNYYWENSFAIDISNIDLVTFKKILAIIKEEIDKKKNSDIINDLNIEKENNNIEPNNLWSLEERRKVVDYMYNIIDNRSIESINYDRQNNTIRKYFFDKDYNWMSYWDINKKNIIWWMWVLGINWRNLDDIIIVVWDLTKYKKEDTKQILELLWISMDNLNWKDFSKVWIPKIIDWWEWRDILFVTGDTNLTNTDIKNIENVIIF